MLVFGLLIFYLALLFPVFSFAATPSQYGLQEGDLISALGDPDIYIINENGYKRLFLNPAIFGFYGHLGGWENVKEVSAQTRDAFPTSLYFKNCEIGDSRVYAVEVTGEDESTLHWLNVSLAKIEGEDPNFSQKVFCINDKEFRWYSISGDYSSTSQVAVYRRGIPAAAAQTLPKEKKLVRLADDPRIYYLADNGVKKHIISPEVFESYVVNKWEDIVVIDRSELDLYPIADLVRKAGDVNVYKLDDGKKHLIPDAETFNSLGLNWDKIIQINEVEFGAYPIGDMLAIPQKPSVEPEAIQETEDVTQKSEEPPSSPEDTTPPPQHDTTLPKDTIPQDTTAPTIVGFSISNLTDTTVSINWSTNESADGQIEFGTSPCPCTNNTPLVSSLIIDHIIDLFTLIPDTTYYYRIKSKDSSGNLITATTQTFKTAAVPPLPDTTSPFRSNRAPSGTLVSGTLQATLSLTTDENATCRYSKNSNTYDSMSTTFSTTEGTSHSVQVSGLAYGEFYIYYVRCVDAAGNKNNYDMLIYFNVITIPTPTQTTFLVKPYLVYPADKAMYPEYETSVKNYLIELQNWYRDKVGATFTMEELKVVRSSRNYLEMRCGENPNSMCIDDQSKLEGNWAQYMNEAIHGGTAIWEEETAVLVFGAGGGGYAGANKYENYAGWALVSDWVLEPISGVVNTWGTPCFYSDVWQCAGGVPRGTPAHELGHAFGLSHPDPDIYMGSSIMKWHGDYPTAGFLQHEIDFLLQSPFFQ